MVVFHELKKKKKKRETTFGTRTHRPCCLFIRLVPINWLNATLFISAHNRCTRKTLGFDLFSLPVLFHSSRRSFHLDQKKRKKKK